MRLQADCGSSLKAAIVKDVDELSSELLELKSTLKAKAGVESDH